MSFNSLTKGGATPARHRPRISVGPWAIAVRAILFVALAAIVTSCTSSDQILRTAKPVPTSSSSKYAAIVIDANTGRVLHADQADSRRYPASLTKMMTVYMLFEAIQQGRVSASTEIPVSAYAASRAPTKLHFKPGQTIDVDTAIRALVTRSANDVATAVAEHLGGSEANFAAMMTTKARQLGMGSTVFRNASGLPDAGQVSTARDMATLSLALRRHFPSQYGYFGRTSFTFRGKSVRGHNKVLETVRGSRLEVACRRVDGRGQRRATRLHDGAVDRDRPSKGFGTLRRRSAGGGLV